MRDWRVITQERALETLHRYNIAENQLAQWEIELGLDIPVDQFGNKQYSQLHINLFKNIQKHLTLGRSMAEISRLVILPPKSDAIASPDKGITETPTILSNPITAGPSSISAEQDMVRDRQVEIHQTVTNSLHNRILNELKPLHPAVGRKSTSGEKPVPVTQLVSRPNTVLKRFATRPVMLTASSLAAQPGTHAGLLLLIERLLGEKDSLHEKITGIEKQKTHLHKANDLYLARVKELSEEVDALKHQQQSNANLKLMDEKSRLQKQLLAAEQRQSEIDKQVQSLSTEARQLRDSLASKVNPQVFIGNWLEEAELSEVAFDNFGINIESKRSRMFRITTPPERIFGHAAIIETTYDYQTNTLWKRKETLILSIIHENRLEGEMIAEYTLDGTLVAKAIYRIKCHRNGIQ